MRVFLALTVSSVIAIFISSARADDPSAPADNTGLSIQPNYLADASPAPAKGPPLPFHDIEGYGGGAITPIAYLVNATPHIDGFLGYPAVAGSYVNLGEKNLVALTATETLFGRVELGYGADRLDLGRLPNRIQKATGVDIDTNDVWLNNFNLRVLALPENSFNEPFLPAITGGVHLKYNDGISSINNKLGDALGKIGYKDDYGFDFTLTASKMLPKLAFGRPVIVTVGGRESDAEQIGALGFSRDYTSSFEGNIVYLPTNWLVLAYEFRQKNNTYGQIPGLIGKEGNWNAFDTSLILGDSTTLVLGYGIFGNLADSKANSAWWLQLKYEF